MMKFMALIQYEKNKTRKKKNKYRMIVSDVQKFEITINNSCSIFKIIHVQAQITTITTS